MKSTPIPNASGEYQDKAVTLYHSTSFLGQLIDFSLHELFIFMLLCMPIFFFLLVAGHCECNHSMSEYFSLLFFMWRFGKFHPFGHYSWALLDGMRTKTNIFLTMREDTFKTPANAPKLWVFFYSDYWVVRGAIRGLEWSLSCGSFLSPNSHLCVDHYLLTL